MTIWLSSAHPIHNASLAPSGGLWGLYRALYHFTHHCSFFYSAVMSFESTSDETNHTLTVEISGFSSADSSLAPSPTGILSACSSHASSSTSLEARLNVKFAPLPELAPRKRRSAAPLGMAARTQMIARRRQQRVVYVDAYQSNSMWTEEELEQQRELAMNEGQRRHSQHHLLSDEEDAMDDPFLALGRMVKVAGKSIWRKVSNKDLSKQNKKEKEKGTKEEELKDQEEKEVEGKSSEESADGTSAEEEEEEEEPTPLEKQRYVRPPTPPKSDDSEDKDEDGSEEGFRTIGQTETIREGDAKYVWITAGSVDDLSGKTPTQSNYTSH
ncbi:hypothetical protein DXG01_010653 [Tephrocybe rancida]|nr:hypothetical protein DXG01_010653 [Tephrocybe rancida]